MSLSSFAILKRTGCSVPGTRLSRSRCSNEARRHPPGHQILRTIVDPTHLLIWIIGLAALSAISFLPFQAHSNDDPLDRLSSLYELRQLTYDCNESGTAWSSACTGLWMRLNAYKEDLPKETWQDVCSAAITYSSKLVGKPVSSVPSERVEPLVVMLNGCLERTVSLFDTTVSRAGKAASKRKSAEFLRRFVTILSVLRFTEQSQGGDIASFAKSLREIVGNARKFPQGHVSMTDILGVLVQKTTEPCYQIYQRLQIGTETTNEHTEGRLAQRLSILYEAANVPTMSWGWLSAKGHPSALQIQETIVLDSAYCFLSVGEGGVSPVVDHNDFCTRVLSEGAISKPAVTFTAFQIKARTTALCGTTAVNRGKTLSDLKTDYNALEENGETGATPPNIASVRASCWTCNTWGSIAIESGDVSHMETAAKCHDDAPSSRLVRAATSAKDEARKYRLFSAFMYHRLVRGKQLRNMWLSAYRSKPDAAGALWTLAQKDKMEFLKLRKQDGYDSLHKRWQEQPASHESRMEAEHKIEEWHLLLGKEEDFAERMLRQQQ